jgi:ATP-binding cassette, subfamily B, heavy metal transporter
MAVRINKKKYMKEIDFSYNLREYWSFLSKYKIKFFLLLILVFLVSVNYIADKYIFKEVIDRGTDFSNGILSKEAFVSILVILVVVFFFVLILRGVLKWFQNTLLMKMSADMVADLKRKYFNHIINLSHGFHVTHKTGSLISRILRGGGAIDRLNDVVVFDLAPLITSMLVVVVSLLLFDVTSAIVLIITCFAFLAYSIFIQNKSKPYGAYTNKKEDIEKAHISDYLTNIDSIKYFGKEKLVQKRFFKISEETRIAFFRFSLFFRHMDVAQAIILGLGVFFLMYFPIIGLLNGELTVGAVVFIYTIYGNVVGPLFSFVHGVRMYYRSMIDFQDLFQYGKIEQEVKDKKDAKEIKIKEGAIEFKDVNFSYEKRKIFKNFSLKIPKDKKVAFVGHSGCGKTTLVKLLYRMYDINKGEILVDGKNIREVKQESLRNEMSMVPQEAVLFDDTIYNNVAFSNPDASRAEVLRAIKFAQLDKIIREFPNKENTIVGERGVKLSGGEKQRVSIARAILADKKILVLDEATSSLDSETEYEIQKDLKKLMEGRTSLIIAHRLSTIMHADIIVVMHRGQIIQMGAHNQLIKKPGEYKKLWNLQKGGYIK